MPSWELRRWVRVGINGTGEMVALECWAGRHHPRMSLERWAFLETPATTGGGQPREICGLTRQRESDSKANEVG